MTSPCCMGFHLSCPCHVTRSRRQLYRIVWSAKMHSETLASDRKLWNGVASHKSCLALLSALNMTMDLKGCTWHCEMSYWCWFHGPLNRYVKLRVAHAPGMPGTLSPPQRVSDLDMHHGTCVTHVPSCMLGSLTSDFLWNRWRGETFPAFPAHAQPAILRIW